MVFFFDKAVCISFFTFSIWTSLIIEDNSSIKPCFLYRFSVYSVTLILHVLICPITSIFSCAFSIMLEFFSSISPLLIKRASSNFGTGVSLFIYTCPCLILHYNSKSVFDFYKYSFIYSNYLLSLFSSFWISTNSLSAFSIESRTPLSFLSISISSFRILNLFSRTFIKESGKSNVCWSSFISGKKNLKFVEVCWERFLDSIYFKGSNSTICSLATLSFSSIFSSIYLLFFKLFWYSSNTLFSIVFNFVYISPSLLISKAAFFVYFCFSISYYCSLNWSLKFYRAWYF